MKIGILGTGIVGKTIAAHLLQQDHQVMIGSRTADNRETASIVCQFPGRASCGTFAATAAFGDILFHCVRGIYSLHAARLAVCSGFTGKTIIDVTNPVDYSAGVPPRLTVCNDSSNGEQLLELLPDSFVLKAFNTLPYEAFTNRGRMTCRKPELYLCGNDPVSKEVVTELIVREFGWKREQVIDLGELKHARSTEALVLIVASLAARLSRQPVRCLHF